MKILSVRQPWASLIVSGVKDVENRTWPTRDYLKPVTRATLPQEIVAAIADLIMARVWKPGDRIPPEKELAARFDVGRSTIRDGTLPPLSSLNFLTIRGPK